MAGVVGEPPVYLQLLLCFSAGPILFEVGFYSIIHSQRVSIKRLFACGLSMFAGSVILFSAFSALLYGNWLTFWQELGL
jgi:hypothetical protein